MPCCVGRGRKNCCGCDKPHGYDQKLTQKGQQTLKEQPEYCPWAEYNNYGATASDPGT
jgi:hypothetical protein